MNTTKKLGVLVFIITILINFSCKKEDKISVNNKENILQARLRMIQQRWNFEKFIHHETQNSISTSDTILGLVGDYFDFRSDHLAYSYWDGLADTVSYTLLDANHLKYANDTFEIKIITTSNFIFTKERNILSTVQRDELQLSR